MRALLACLLLVVSGYGQATKIWKDRAEYDLYDRIARESTGGEKLKLLSEWKRLYPNSDFQRQRLTLFVSAHDAAGQPEETFAAAKELLESDPANLTALRALCKWAPQLKDPPAGTAGFVRKSAEALLARLPEEPTRRNLNSLLDGMETGKPARTERVSDPDRKEQRAELEQIARKALAWAQQ